MPSVIEELPRLLSRRGLHAALALLNERTRFRYTGTYRFAAPYLRNICLYDRENPSVRIMDDLVLQDSYCGIVARSGQHFAVENSLEDTRLTGHPARESMIAYHGYPLRDGTDKCFGSLCHWDVRPRTLPSSESQLLYEVAPLIARAALRVARTPRAPGAASAESSLRP